MSNVIQIKRGSGKPDGKLAPYELGFDTKDNTLYIGGEKKTNDEDEEVYGDALQIRVEQANHLTQNALDQIANAEIVVQKALWATGATDADYAANANYAYNADSATYAIYKAPHYKPDPNTGMEPNCLIAKSDLLNLIYPVGSIYMSVNEVSPSVLFGGEWEQLKDRFLLGAGDTYQNGITGGNTEHTHSIDEHSHKYGIALGAYYGAASYENATHSGALEGGNGEPAAWEHMGQHDSYRNSNATSGSTSASVVVRRSVANTSSEELDTKSTSSLPPYLAVYMWKRTA